MEKRKFFIFSTYGEIFDLAYHLHHVEKQEVIFHVHDPDYKKIGDGIVPRADDWYSYMGKGYIWLIDGCENAKMQDWMRSRGEKVIGTNEVMAEYENNRQKGQALFEKAGFDQVESHNFTDFDDAIDFIEQNLDTRWVLKQNGDAPKHLNHIGKFEGNEDMIFHLEEMKKQWSEASFGPIDFDLMELVEGLEVAASAFFNGKDFLRDANGRVVGYLNYEEKKEADGGKGETCGETGTTFKGITEDDEMFREMIMKPVIVAELKRTNYVGAIDNNCIWRDDGTIVALELTSRFGVPWSSYGFIEGLDMPLSDFLSILAKGKNEPVKIHPGWGMVIVITAKPFPIEADIPEEETSLGEKLWILKDGEPVEDFSLEQMRHIHLENFRKSDEGNYLVASKNGYLLTVTGRGKDIEDTREHLMEYIEENIYIAGGKWRTDIGVRVENY